MDRAGDLARIATDLAAAAVHEGASPDAVSALAAGLGTLSAAAVNPARQLGPARWSGDDTFLLSHLIGPVAGAPIGAWIHLRLVREPVATFRWSGVDPRASG